MSDPSFMINRRVAMQLMAGAGLAASAPGIVHADTATSDLFKSQLPETPPTGTRFNLEEAQRVMHELEIDALVLGEGRNFQQATGSRPAISKMGRPPVDLAILVADPEPRVMIVMLGFSYYYLASDVHGFPDSDVFLWGFADASELDEAAALDTLKFADRGEEPLRSIEQHRITATEQVLEKESLRSSMGEALFAALKSANVTAGRIGFDNPSIGRLLAEFVPDATTTTADDVLRRTRTVKSATEIELMRISSKINIEAANAALQQIGAGASHKDLRAAFYSELARRGASGVFMVIDHVSDEQFDADLVNGQTFLIDCVCDHMGYLGDYGRTIFIGDPVKSAARAQVAVAKSWDKLRGELKPGLKFSDIRTMGQKAMQEQGSTYRVSFNPHSVGVFHSDHVGDGSSAPREDIVLRPGMILSIDCPVLESGFGGSVHLEDLMLITEDGAEPIHDLGTPAITI